MLLLIPLVRSLQFIHYNRDIHVQEILQIETGNIPYQLHVLDNQCIDEQNMINTCISITAKLVDK